MGPGLAANRPLTDEEIAHWANHGLFTYETFQPVVAREPEWLIRNLVNNNSVNLLVGDSNLGKTPLCLTMGIAVAGGADFLGHPTRPGRVLYCDAESGKREFNRMLQSISDHLGLARVPKDFLVWSPTWGKETPADVGDELFKMVERTAPTLVIVDTLRTFFPEAIEDPKVVAKLVRAMRTTGATWLMAHHRRKASRDGSLAPNLVKTPGEWMQEAAGTLAIVNCTDTRLGVEAVKAGNAELVIGGIIRGESPLTPIYLARAYDVETSKALGYQLAIGTAFLNVKDREVYENLPDQFRFKDVQRLFGGTSESTVKRFLKLADSLQIAKRDGKNGYRKTPTCRVDGVTLLDSDYSGVNPLQRGVE